MKLNKGDSFKIISNVTDLRYEFAVTELKKYLCLAGLEYASDGVCFTVDYDNTLKSEGMSIAVENDTITILGEGNGILYGVYEFLERFIGFNFGAYTEVVPQKDEYLIENTKYVKNGADLCYRTAVAQYSVWAGDPDRALTPAFIDWLAKNRYNRVLTWVSVYEGLKEKGLMPEFEKRGIKLSVGHHQSIFTFLPPEKYLKTNPEYYRLEKDGSRFDPSDYNGQLVLCCRNDECIAEVAKNAISWLKENPNVDCLAFWPNDGKADQCCCEKCAPYSKIENYLYFENELAKRIRKELPDIKIDVLIYIDLWDCPENMQLCDGVVIDEAVWSANGLRNCGAPDGSGIIGTDYAKNILKYRKNCKNTVFYDYYMGNYNARQRLMPATDEMQSIFKFCVQNGISGSGTQFECFNVWNNLLNFFAFARTQYDTELDFETVLARFSTLFGNGGKYVIEIMKMAERVCDGQDSIRNMGIYTMQNLDMTKVYALFDKALESETNPVCRNNLRMLRLAFRYSDLLTSDKTEDTAREPHPLTCIDPTGELAYMSYTFDGYHNKNSLYGIAMPLTNKNDKKPDSVWYDFE